jgi:phosphonate metabolism-associated iron-containing alcohol dehydrogenase
MSGVAEFHPTQFWNPVRITFGPDSLQKLPEIFAGLPGRRVALITDRSILDAVGIADRLTAWVGNRELSIFDGAEPNPSVTNAQAAVDFSRKSGAEVILGIGGGSALDVAKIVAATIPNGGEVMPILEKQVAVSAASLPTVMLPTTAGTGSEVTRWGTLWDHELKKKYSMEGMTMYPTHAVLDPKLTLTLPEIFTSTTGMDALSHAMEAYWNKNANAVSDVYALEAVRRIFEALPMVVGNPINLEHRSKMLFASLLAGLAFSNTKTAAAHSLSYPMTLNFGVVHGQASSITLPALLRFNAEASLDRMTQLSRAVGGNSIDSGARRIQVLLQRVGLKTSLSELGIDANGIELCVREGYTPDRAGHNLRDLDANGLREVLQMVA